MKRYFGLLILSCWALLSFAQTPFEQANAAYAEANYESAIEQYNELIQTNPSAFLYYNLGNAYYKTGELGKSILNYERALRLNPHFKDAQYNLELAQSKIVDNIDSSSTFFLSKVLHLVIRSLREQEWLILSVVLFVVCLCGLMVFAFSHALTVRKIGFHTAWVVLLVSVMSLCFALVEHHEDRAQAQAIVLSGIVNAKSSPDKSGTDLFVLHEGTKVEIKSTLSDWAEIEVGNNTGWVRLSTLERI